MLIPCRNPGGKMEVKKSFYTTVEHPFHIDRVEPVNCNLCGGAEYHELVVEHDFSIRECSRCKLIYVSPQPASEELTQFYEGMYTDASSEDAQIRSLGYVETHLSGVVKASKPDGGRLLEIGCGYGRFLEALAGQSWQITGVDASERALALARLRIPGGDFRVGVIETLDFPPDSFDCIVLIAVLEHVKDPTAVIQRLTRWLAPGGLLLIQVPYIGPFIKLKRFIPRLPIHFEAPRHLFDFSPAILFEYFTRANYTQIRVEIARPYASPTRLGAYLIWAVKAVGLALYYCSGRRYVYPFASAIVVHGVKRLTPGHAT